MSSNGRPRFYVNILATDSGFAPNPFHGVCTLACCRPPIRRCARKGDWVIGITPKDLGNKLAYAMRVTEEPISFAEYFRDARFALKKPSRSSGKHVDALGDNCYEPLPNNRFRQLPCVHYDDKARGEDQKLKHWDLSGKFVLISRDFAYFGSEPLPLDKSCYGFMIPARFNRVNFTLTQEKLLSELVGGLLRGVHARPRNWEGDDDSWRRRTPRCR